MLKLKNFLNEIGVATVLGIGYIILKKSVVKGDIKYENFEYLSKSAFVNIVGKFEHLHHHDFENFLTQIDYFVKLSIDVSNKCTKTSGCQFQANRLSESITAIAENMIECGKKSTDEAIVFAAIDCERDDLGTLKSICENTLMNMLLDIH